MDIKPEQVSDHLARGALAPIYLLAGDEPLLLDEATSAIRAAAVAQGFDERRVLHAEPGFDWSELTAAVSEPSLFSSRQLIELRLSSKGPGQPGSAAIKDFAARAPADCMLLVHAGRLDADQRRSAWYKTIQSSGHVIYAWPFPVARLPQWIERRATARGLTLDEEALAVLVARTEGNLLAAAQEIERLTLLFPEGRVDADGMRAATGDSARFDVFDLSTKALDADTAGVVRSLDRLREAGIDPVPVLWALVQDLRLLFTASLAARHGGVDRVVNDRRVRMPPARRAQIGTAARQRRPRELLALLRRAAHVDRVCKGAARGRPWEELLTLALGLAGRPMAVSAPESRTNGAP